jgi:peptidoglycan/LPS O-acetylase OafA/YrhL
MQHKIYFKNLNGLRFIAALIVLVSHVSQLIDYLGVKEKFAPVINSPVQGELGVLLFFALSGFLITYLLLLEDQLTSTVSIKAFYIRRILRIWPLYFLTILLAFFVLPFIGFLNYKGYDVAAIWLKLPCKLFFYCIFMPNIVMDFLGFVPYATHTWTIGAEEQFYFIWPVLFKKIRNKVFIFILVILIYLTVYYVLNYLSADNKYIKISFLIWSRYPISCMAIGGIYAYMLFIKNSTTEKIKQLFFTAWFQLAMLGLLIVLIGFKIHFIYLHNEIYSLLLGYQVFNLATNPTPIFNLENKVFNYLGKISYGLYMFHPLAIGGAVKICLLINYTRNILVYPLAGIIAVALASACYQLLEKYFIAKKIKYSIVVSGDNIK